MSQGNAFTLVQVRNLAACTEFLRDGLGMTLEESSEKWARLAIDGTVVILKASEEGSHNSRVQKVRLGLAVEDLESVCQKLKERSVKFVAAPHQTELGLEATCLDPEGNLIDLIHLPRQAGGRLGRVTERSVVNDILVHSPEAMEVLEEHGIRICGGCIVLLNGTVRETAEYSGLLGKEAATLVEELNQKIRPHK